MRDNEIDVCRAVEAENVDAGSIVDGTTVGSSAIWCGADTCEEGGATSVPVVGSDCCEDHAGVDVGSDTVRVCAWDEVIDVVTTVVTDNVGPADAGFEGVITLGSSDETLVESTLAVDGMNPSCSQSVGVDVASVGIVVYATAGADADVTTDDAGSVVTGTRVG